MSDSRPKPLKRAAVIGSPIAHSLSPVIHHYWAQKESRKGSPGGRYIKIDVENDFEAFAQTLDGLKQQGFAGVNVTLPHKEHALRYASRVSDGAKAAGAANMVTFTASGADADNSDIDGFALSLSASLGEGARREAALVLGAGGAARGVILALQRAGYQRITLCNRTKSRAEAIAADLGGGLSVIDWSARSAALSDMDLLVNTTALGMKGAAPLDIALDKLPAGSVVCDIVYTPLETPLLAAAKARGNLTVDGLSMLMHQAVPGYKAWLGDEAVVDDELRTLLIAALENRET